MNQEGFDWGGARRAGAVLAPNMALLDLPIEMVHEVARHLSGADRAALRATCRQLAHLLPIQRCYDLEGMLLRLEHPWSEKDRAFWRWAFPLTMRRCTGLARTAVAGDMVDDAIQCLRDAPFDAHALKAILSQACLQGAAAVIRHLLPQVGTEVSPCDLLDEWRSLRMWPNLLGPEDGYVATLRCLAEHYRLDRGHDACLHKVAMACCWMGWEHGLRCTLGLLKRVPVDEFATWCEVAVRWRRATVLRQLCEREEARGPAFEFLRLELWCNPKYPEKLQMCMAPLIDHAASSPSAGADGLHQQLRAKPWYAAWRSGLLSGKRKRE